MPIKAPPRPGYEELAAELHALRTEHANHLADVRRILGWLKNPDRPRAAQAFTAGPERLLACEFEMLLPRKAGEATAEHTKEPWRTERGAGGFEVWADAGRTGSMRIAACGHAATFDHANARRIAACVNACAGMDTACLEDLARSACLPPD